MGSADRLPARQGRGTPEERSPFAPATGAIRMKVLERALLSAATATLICCSGAYGQSTGNLLNNPDMVLDAYDGRTSRTVTMPFGGTPLVFGGSAAADWAYVTVQFAGSLTIDTELVPSDFM